MIEAAKSGSINMVEIDERAVYLWQVKKSSKSKILHIEKNMLSKYNEIEFALQPEYTSTFQNEDYHEEKKKIPTAEAGNYIYIHYSFYRCIFPVFV